MKIKLQNIEETSEKLSLKIENSNNKSRKMKKYLEELYLESFNDMLIDINVNTKVLDQMVKRI